MLHVIILLQELDSRYRVTDQHSLNMNSVGLTREHNHCGLANVCPIMC